MEYNAKVISAETIARVLDNKKECASAEIEKTSDKKSKSDETTDKPAPIKRGRKKKKDAPADTSQPAAV